MSDNKSFTDFHNRLKDIRNSLYHLGKPITKTKIVNKILRFLPLKFIPKITVIEKNKDLALTENELLGSLKTFEFNIPTNTQHNLRRNL